MIKLDNHRRLGDTEKIRKGDFYKNIQTGEVCPVANSIGRTPRPYSYGFTFWRRKHTKKVTPVAPALKRAVAKAQTSVAKYPTVTFHYKATYREVQVIALTDNYLTGLEVNRDGDKPKYQFKKFLRRRIQDTIELRALADKE